MRKSPVVAWCVVRTKQCAEYLAESEMRRVGLETYLPQFRREYRHHRSKRWITKAFPLFQGYVFARVGNHSALRDLDGVDREGAIVDGFGNVVTIPDDVIVAVREREEIGEFDELRRQGYRVNVGEHVMVSDGPWVNLPGLIKSVRSADHVKVLVNLFGRPTTLTTSLAKIQRAA